MAETPVGAHTQPQTQAPKGLGQKQRLEAWRGTKAPNRRARRAGAKATVTRPRPLVVTNKRAMYN
jgi:hypothetical protein